MSVLVINLETIEPIKRKVKSFQYHKQCDINYCNTLSISDAEANKFITDLFILNCMSYDIKYKEELREIIKEEGALKEYLINDNHLVHFITRKDREQQLSTLELYKLFIFLEYNIEMEEIKEYCIPRVYATYEKSYDLLKKSIRELSHTLVTHYSPYKDLNWGKVNHQRIE